MTLRYLNIIVTDDLYQKIECKLLFISLHIIRIWYIYDGESLPTSLSSNIRGYPLFGYFPLSCHTSKKGFQSIKEMSSLISKSSNKVVPTSFGWTVMINYKHSIRIKILPNFLSQQVHAVILTPPTPLLHLIESALVSHHYIHATSII